MLFNLNAIVYLFKAIHSCKTCSIHLVGWEPILTLHSLLVVCSHGMIEPKNGVKGHLIEINNFLLLWSCGSDGGYESAV